MLLLMLALQSSAFEGMTTPWESKTPYQMCVESCLDSFRPGYELKACVKDCEVYIPEETKEDSIDKP